VRGEREEQQTDEVNKTARMDGGGNAAAEQMKRTMEERNDDRGNG